MSIEARRALIETWTEKWRQGGDGYLVMLHDDEIVGSIGLHVAERRIEYRSGIGSGPVTPVVDMPQRRLDYSPRRSSI